MVNSSDIETLLGDIHRLMQLKGENPFKVRAFEKAQGIISGRSDLVARAKAGTLTELEGIGKGISEVITEFVIRGKSTVMEELQKEVPASVIELTEVPGLGPKKAIQLVKELGIQTLGELEYACRENRLVKAKGFGAATQAKILKGIEFLKSTRGLLRIDDAQEHIFPILSELQKIAKRLEPKNGRVELTGELRRSLETVAKIEFICTLEKPADRTLLEKQAQELAKEAGLKLPLKFHYSTLEQWGYDWAYTTGSEAHWHALGSPEVFKSANENAFYGHFQLPEIPPEMRETGEEVGWSKQGGLAEVIQKNQIQGIFHNHTTRSDGTASLDQMVSAAGKLGYRYIGISDHSQTAVYAQGLKNDDLKAQEKEIREVQDKHPEIKIFWGIESDILADGSLDYEPAVLKRFDFVVASVHSRFQMDRAAMTERILAAVRNPYTRFLGHLTGRLLLGRNPYDLDVEKIIQAASEHNVAIEINANPARLDIDWRWGAALREQETLVSVNPDAHDLEGLEHTRYGVTVARKALLPTIQVINSRSIEKVEKWLKRL